jgi:hypothetical protein
MEKLNFPIMKFPWIYTFIGASGIEMGLMESLVAMETGAYLRVIMRSNRAVPPQKSSGIG